MVYHSIRPWRAHVVPLSSACNAETGKLQIIKKASGKEGYVRICEEYAYSSLHEVYNRIKTKDDGKENSGEDVLNTMLGEIEDSQN